MAERDYTNTQRSPLCYLIALPGVGCFIGGVSCFGEAPVMITLFSLSGLFFFLTFAFKWLETSGQGDHLLVRYGPLPSFRKRVRYDGVRGAKRDRSLLIEGWGIHLGPRGWIWNLWGRGVVELEREEGRLRIGTDDPEGLIAHLRERCDLE
jgi:hypothetical protein